MGDKECPGGRIPTLLLWFIKGWFKDRGKELPHVADGSLEVL
jgi:hypothetical protein